MSERAIGIVGVAFDDMTLDEMASRSAALGFDHLDASIHLLDGLDDAAIDALATRVGAPSPGVSIFFLEHLHGRASASGPGDSAFSHRRPGYSFAALSIWIDPAESDACTTWVREFFAEMAPFLASGVYSNYLAGDEGEARVRAAYGPAWDRLVGLKRAYDPENVFRLNQNVSPG